MYTQSSSLTRPLGSKEIMETGIRTMRVTQRENVEGEGGESGRKQRARGGAGPMTREDLRKGQQERVRKKREKN